MEQKTSYEELVARSRAGTLSIAQGGAAALKLTWSELLELLGAPPPRALHFDRLHERLTLPQHYANQAFFISAHGARSAIDLTYIGSSHAYASWPRDAVNLMEAVRGHIGAVTEILSLFSGRALNEIAFERLERPDERGERPERARRARALAARLLIDSFPPGAPQGARDLARFERALFSRHEELDLTLCLDALRPSFFERLDDSQLIGLMQRYPQDASVRRAYVARFDAFSAIADPALPWSQRVEMLQEAMRSKRSFLHDLHLILDALPHADRLPLLQAFVTHGWEELWGREELRGFIEGLLVQADRDEHTALARLAHQSAQPEWSAHLRCLIEGLYDQVLFEGPHAARRRQRAGAIACAGALARRADVQGDVAIWRCTLQELSPAQRLEAVALPGLREGEQLELLEVLLDGEFSLIETSSNDAAACVEQLLKRFEAASLGAAALSRERYDEIARRVFVQVGSQRQLSTLSMKRLSVVIKRYIRHVDRHGVRASAAHALHDASSHLRDRDARRAAATLERWREELARGGDVLGALTSHDAPKTRRGALTPHNEELS